MDPSAIIEQIDRILRSRSFASKSQLRKLLQVLHENMHSQITLKPDQVIKELWPAEIRTKRSADVAAEMNRLRRALKSYYEGEGARDSITICLPNRAVAAANETRERPWIIAKLRADAEDNAAADHQPRSHVNPRKGRRIAGLGAVLGAALVIVGDRKSVV